ncbi:hypothetical protein BROUX41_001932 [Berkeleyomyces rouxiae]|uniref:uncharacterized protein n=1 Tax=Berkeleyomyces rouxiae TaxID=2035830 RepID=UPI003B7CF34E
MTDQSVPLLVRPVPRRPFVPAFSSPTPPPDSAASDDAHDFKTTTARFLRTFNTDPAASAPATPTSPALSRSGSSFFNLRLNLSGIGLASSPANNTSSTLGGIFSPSMTSADRFFDDSESTPSSPWENGSQSPIWRQGLDNSTYDLIKKRSNLRHQPYRPSSFDMTARSIPPSTSPAPRAVSSGAPDGVLSRLSCSPLPIRIAILFVLGAAYGNVLAGLNATRNGNSLPRQLLDWRYLIAWGCVGVACGIILPYVDAVWDSVFSEGEQDLGSNDVKLLSSHNRADTLREWTLALQSIATFVAIVFAIVGISSVIILATGRLLI